MSPMREFNDGDMITSKSAKIRIIWADTNKHKCTFGSTDMKSSDLGKKRKWDGVASLHLLWKLEMLLSLL